MRPVVQDPAKSSMTGSKPPRPATEIESVGPLATKEYQISFAVEEVAPPQVAGAFDWVAPTVLPRKGEQKEPIGLKVAVAQLLFAGAEKMVVKSNPISNQVVVAVPVVAAAFVDVRALFEGAAGPKLARTENKLVLAPEFTNSTMRVVPVGNVNC